MRTGHRSGLLCAMTVMVAACGNAEVTGPAMADAPQLAVAGAAAVPGVEGVVAGQRLVGPAGGTVRTADVTLEIPAGALSSAVLVTMTVQVGPDRLVRLEPAGTALARPAVLRAESAGGAAILVHHFGGGPGTDEVQGAGFILVGG